MAFKDDISMQEYYGSFPTTSKATAVSRRTGVRKISVTPNLNAIGPSGDERAEEAFDRIPSPANPSGRSTNIGPRTGDGTTIVDKLKGGAGSSDEDTDAPKAGGALKSYANFYVLGGAALLLALLVYRKFKK